MINFPRLYMVVCNDRIFFRRSNLLLHEIIAEVADRYPEVDAIDVTEMPVPDYLKLLGDMYSSGRTVSNTLIEDGALPQDSTVEQPFDPATLGFTLVTPTGAAFEGWVRRCYTIYMLDEKSIQVVYLDEMGERHKVYEGARPESHTFAVAIIIFRHLGLEIT